MSWRERAPGPFSLWARFVPRTWPATSSPHVDPLAGTLASRSVARADLDEPLPALAPLEADVTYLPPIAEERRRERDALAREIAAMGGHALVHLRSGEIDFPAGATPVVDLLDPLVRGAVPAAVEIPERAWVVVPLTSGLFEDAERRLHWLKRLSEKEVTAIGVPLELQPTERRALADAAGEARWEAIFHGAAPDERDFARAAAAAGLVTLPGQPEISLPPRAARNRALAGALAEAAELCLRLGRGEVEGEALRAAARRVAGEPLDFAALAREGNLGVVDWLSPLARRVIEEQPEASDRDSGLLSGLRAAWRGEVPA